MNIIFPDHTAAIYGATELIRDFAKANGFTAIQYPLASLRQALKAGDASWLREQTGAEDTALFFVPTTVPVDQAMLDFCGGTVQAFATASTGTDHVDLELLERKGIPFLSAPGENATAVVEYVLSALPLLFDPERLLRGDLSLGIIGYGRIGGLLGRVSHRLGFRVRAYDPFVLTSQEHNRLAALDSDVVTFHLPLTTDGPHPTAGMIDERWLEASRPGTVWMNSGRGPIFSPEKPHIFEESLRRFRTVYDVFPQEPPLPVWIQHTFLASPHVAGYTWRGRFMGVYRVLSDYASAAGLRMVGQPADYRPSVFDVSGPSFLSQESAVLKAEPSSFSPRRNAYPPRSSFRDDLEMGIVRTDYTGTEEDEDDGTASPSSASSSSSGEVYFRRLLGLWDEMRL